MELIEQILSSGNIALASARVVANQGTPGIDGMNVRDLRGYLLTAKLASHEAGNP